MSSAPLEHDLNVSRKLDALGIVDKENPRVRICGQRVVTAEIEARDAIVSLIARLTSVVEDSTALGRLDADDLASTAALIKQYQSEVALLLKQAGPSRG